GTVANIEPMQSTTATPPSGLGTVIGGVAGGVVGNQVGGGSGRALVTLAGVVAGAIVGNNLEAQNGSQVRQTWRISIRIDNGPYRAFDVASPGDLRVGDRVRVEGGQISRL
ncbi:MAG TPA: glycine zipper 2TM domain-containing protein, partial [Burkholderiaceae bacterium]